MNHDGATTSEPHDVLWRVGLAGPERGTLLLVRRYCFRLSRVALLV